MNGARDEICQFGIVDDDSIDWENHDGMAENLTVGTVEEEMEDEWIRCGGDDFRASMAIFRICNISMKGQINKNFTHFELFQVELY